MLLINSDAAGTSLHPSQRPTVGRVGPSMSRGSRKLSWIDLDAGFLDDLGPVRRLAVYERTERLRRAAARIGADLARGRVCEHERRRAKAICVWKQRQSVGLLDKAELFALTTRIRRATRLPDVIALCDEVERLACSATQPKQPAPVALHKPGCIECERRRKQTRDLRCSVTAQ